MTELEVYGTQGQCLHPKDVSKQKPEYTGFFNQINFFADLTDEHLPMFDAYTNVERGGGRREQVFINYEGTSRETLFEDCRDAVKDELAGERGWNLNRNPPPTEPDAIFANLVLQESRSSRDYLRGTTLDENQRIVDDLLDDPSATIKISVRGYTIAADLIRHFSDRAVKIVVAQGSYRDEGDIVLKKGNHEQAVQISNETIQLIEDRREELREEMIRQEYESIQESLRKVRELDEGSSRAKEALNTVLDNTYRSLEIEDKQTLNDLRQRPKARRTPARQATTTSTTARTTSGGSNSSLPVKPRYMLFGLAAFIALGVAAFVVIQGGSGIPSVGGGEPAVSNPNVSSNDMEILVTAQGQSDADVSLEITNGTGNIIHNESLSLDSDGNGFNANHPKVKDSGDYFYQVEQPGDYYVKIRETKNKSNNFEQKVEINGSSSEGDTGTATRTPSPTSTPTPTRKATPSPANTSTPKESTPTSTESGEATATPTK